MKVLINYNFDPKDIMDLNFKALYEEKRRDSCFAFAFEKDGKIYALRDHFGTVPLFFTRREDKIVFSTTLDPLVVPESSVDLKGYKAYIAFGTTKILPIFKDIEIVPPGSVIEVNEEDAQIKLLFKYKFKRHKLSGFCGMNKLVELLDHLLLQAVKRTIKHNEVGLYFSGMGVDSLLTAIYLTKCGVKVNTYTCARWGKKGSELKYSRITAEKIGIKNHFVDVLDSEKVEESLDKIFDLYGGPHGTSAAIGVTSLWLHTPLVKEKQVYGAQGADTINCAVAVQNKAYVYSFIPRFIRRLLSDKLSGSLIDNYVRLASRGLLSARDIPSEIMDSIQAMQGRIPRLSIAGMLICHTPGDGEALSAPAINSNILYSNIFYDVDVAEFFLGIPFAKRLNFTFSLQLLDKIVLRRLAQRESELKDIHYILKMKKGFNLPLHVYGLSEQLERTKPLINIPSDTESKFAAYVFSKYCKLKNLKTEE